MVAKIVVLYGHPQDAEAFDTYYGHTHAPIAKAVPGLTSFTTSVGPVGTPAGPSDYHRVATLSWDSMADLQAALSTAEGGAAAGDVANFATGGATMLVYEERDA
ncbi:MAG TPA: EthD family reductase [Microlunatus sp.]